MRRRDEIATVLVVTVLTVAILGLLALNVWIWWNQK